VPSRLPRLALLTVGAVVCFTGTMLPWVGAEGSRRSSYQLAAGLDRLDLLDEFFSTTLIRAWPVVPVGLALAAALYMLRLDRSSRVCAAAVGIVVTGGCAVSWSVPLPSHAGVTIAFLGALVLLTGAALPARWIA